MTVRLSIFARCGRHHRIAPPVFEEQPLQDSRPLPRISDAVTATATTALSPQKSGAPANRGTPPSTPLASRAQQVPFPALSPQKSGAPASRGTPPSTPLASRAQQVRSPAVPDQDTFDNDPFTPAKRFKLERKGSRFAICPTPNTKAAMAAGQRILYSFKMDAYTAEDGTPVSAKRYIGYSENGVGRLALHIFGFNHADKAGRQFYLDVKEHPERLSWGIIRTLRPDEDPATAETTAIRTKDSRSNGYNIRLGGGGGRSQQGSTQTCPYTISEIVDMIRPTYQSPDPKKLLKKVRVRHGKPKEAFFLPLSEADKRARNVVYDFFFENSDEKKDRVHHIGQTSRTFGARSSEHFSAINNPDSNAGRAIPLYKKIRATPDRVRVRVFNVEELLTKGIPLPLLEKAFMQYFISRGEEVENAKSGGKGPVCR